MSYNTYRHEDELKATIQTLTHGTAARRMCHLHLGSEPLPNWEMIGDIITLCRSLIFPGFFGNDDVNAFSLEYRIGIECEQLKSALENQILAGLCIEQKTRTEAETISLQNRAEDIAQQFINRLPDIRQVMHTDY